MNISDIVKREDDNRGLIILHAEGIFWRAYEHSAYAFLTQVAQMQVLKRAYKNLGGRVVFYLGFPMKAAENYLQNLEEVEKEEKILVLKAPYTWDEDEYLKWHNEMAKSEDDVSYELQELIKSYDVSSSTPIDAFNFILLLKRKIKEKGDGQL